MHTWQSELWFSVVELQRLNPNCGPRMPPSSPVTWYGMFGQVKCLDARGSSDDVVLEAATTVAALVVAVVDTVVDTLAVVLAVVVAARAREANAIAERVKRMC